MNKYLPKITLATSLIIFVVFSASALARTTPNESTVKAQEAVKTRLEGSKLKACENREIVINKILDRIAARGEKRLNVYTVISERVQEFYTKKDLSVSNYDELVAEVNSKKAAAETAIETTKNKQIEFNCDGSDPKGYASGFKADLKAEIQALHAYQQSIKDMIVAVKTAIADSNQNNSDNSDGGGN